MKTKFKGNTISHLDMKMNRFLFFYVILFTCLTIVYAQDTPPQDAAETELDFKALLAAIKRYDTRLKSGEGEVVYTFGQPPFDTDTRIVTGHIAFDAENTRFDSLRKTTIFIPIGMWEIDNNRNSYYYFKPDHYFTTEPKLIFPYHGVDPRQWLTPGSPAQDLATYLKDENFQITGREFINDILCYVLETKQGDKSKKIWIAPERGFRYLRYESQYPTPVDALDSDIPMEALTIFRTTISYQQFGEIWFPKAVFSEYAWLDFKATEPIISRQTLEIKNFKVNHTIPPETFTVDIPDDAMIKVEGISKKLSKQEFIKQYGQQ